MRSSLRRRKPWIVALIVVIVAIMVLPLYDVINVLGQRQEVSNQPSSFNPQDYMDEIKERVDNMEGFLADNEPTMAVLKELSSLYMTLSYFVSEEEEGDDYLSKAILRMEEAIELNPLDTENYLTLYDLYNYSGEYEKALEAASQGERLVLEKLDNNPDDNVARMEYTSFLTNFRGDSDAGIAQLDIIMASEPEDSDIFIQAEYEKERLLAEKEAESEAAAEAKREAEARQEDEGIEMKIGD